MTWSYNPSLADAKDRVRLLIGDTDTDDQQLSDEEIGYLVDENDSVQSAAAAASRILSAKYARKADRQVGDLRISFSQIAKQYTDLADKLSATSAGYAAPSAGGVYAAEKTAWEGDDTVLKPAIRLGIHDNV